tara:strand:+ start:202 stop:543 length:342 start_codon:yes stop_codon:yes gene_type:complete
MAALDIESGRPPKATRPLLLPPYPEEPITRVSPPGVPKTLVAPAPTDSNDAVGITTTPQDTVYKINIEDEQVLDILPRAPFFSMGSLFKPFTFSRPSSAEGGAAFLPLGPDQC